MDQKSCDKISGFREKEICCCFVCWLKTDGRFTFERIHNTKEQIYFYERAEKQKAKEWMFKSFK